MQSLLIKKIITYIICMLYLTLPPIFLMYIWTDVGGSISTPIILSAFWLLYASLRVKEGDWP